MGSADDHTWVSLKQAALRLGLSEKTIRRRVEAGRLEGRKMSTPTGPAWLIRVDDVHPMMLREGVGSGTVLPTHTAGLVEALAMIERQQQQITEMAGRIGYQQAELDQLRQRLAVLDVLKEEPLVAPVPQAVDPSNQEAAISQSEPTPPPEAPAAPQPGRLRRVWQWFVTGD